ncbi:hypothetical protein ACFFYR_06145 [Paraburkholderia dipogonis]|uniref:hypothetical protein n=1 Tax=Paraburkholderia dipogonis TaxID=1211383 RepID=UPI0035E50B84
METLLSPLKSWSILRNSAYTGQPDIQINTNSCISFSVSGFFTFFFPFDSRFRCFRIGFLCLLGASLESLAPLCFYGRVLVFLYRDVTVVFGLVFFFWFPLAFACDFLMHFTLLRSLFFTGPRLKNERNTDHSANAFSSIFIFVVFFSRMPALSCGFTDPEAPKIGPTNQ